MRKIVQDGFTHCRINNTDLNDFRKIICLKKKPVVFVERMSVIMSF